MHMTPEQLEALWQRGQQHEAEGALDAARDAYLEILAGSPRQIMVQVRLSELEQRAGHYRSARKYALDAADTIDNDVHLERFHQLDGLFYNPGNTDDCGIAILRTNPQVIKILWAIRRAGRQMWKDINVQCIQISESQRCVIVENSLNGYILKTSPKNGTRMDVERISFARLKRIRRHDQVPMLGINIKFSITNKKIKT